jgi:hypothetical protein
MTTIFADGAIVSLLNYGTGSALDLDNGRTTNGTNVIGWQYHGGKNQQWRLRKVAFSGAWSTWKLENVQSGTLLDLTEGNRGNGTRIQGWSGSTTSADNKNQLWRLVTADTGGRVVIIQNIGTGTLVDLKEGNNRNGTQVQAWEGRVENQNPNQLWRVLRID